MQFDLVADTTKLCRVCMTAKEGHRTDLHDASSLVSKQSSLYGMLKSVCAPVFDNSEASKPPGMPTKVCAICRNAILAAFKLHQMCIETDRSLRELLSVKRELQDLVVYERTGDPLGSNKKKALRDEVLNISIDEGQDDELPAICYIKTDVESQVLKEEQPTGEMAETLNQHEDTIKVEELNLMEASDNDNGNESDSGESKAEADSSKVTCKICSKSFSKAGMLRKHMTIKHNQNQKLKRKARGSNRTRKVYACGFCEETFKAGIQLRRHNATVHQNVQDRNQPFTCSLCDDSFAKALELLEHKKSHTNSVSCSCGRTFKGEKKLKEHTASGTCFGENDRKCKICNKVFKSIDVMVKHRNSVHSEPVVCSECGKTMANFNSLRMHLRIGYCSMQKDQPPTQSMLAARTCKICGELQKTRFSVKGHMKLAHPDHMFRCESCGKVFLSQRYLDLHKICHSSITYQCQTCTEIFPTKEALKNHRRKHKDPISCSICGKIVRTKYSLSVHMERHVGFKPFSCDICPMRFFTKAEIRGHMLTHSKKQDHVCDLCGSRFTTNHSLKKHVLHVHEGHRPFPCTLCSLKFSLANQLQRHMYTHTGEKPHKCELCPQAYAQTNDLVKHVARSHGDGNPYLCDRCDEGFRLLTDLRQHYRVHVQSTEGGAEQMEEVRFTSVAILQRAFAKAKQRLGIDNGSR